MTLFITAFFTVYVCINLYIFLRFRTAVPPGGRGRILYLLITLLLMTAFPVSHFSEGILPEAIVSVFFWIGSWWIGFMLYIFLFLLLIDLIRFLDRFFHFLPSSWKNRPRHTWGIIAISLVTMAILILLAGHINAGNIRVRKLKIDIENAAGDLRQLNLVAAADLHLGRMVGRNHLEKTVDTINSLNPDLVLLIGDIIDSDVELLQREGMGEILSRLHPRYGVYAVTGNHEYIAGVEASVAFLSRAGITFLRDRVIPVAGGFRLGGRDDWSRRRRSGKAKKLDEILGGSDSRLPLILMDHQPARIEEAVRNETDLLLCAHTHNGQLIPWSWLVKIFFPKIYGHYREGKTHIYVTSGAGTWGPPARVGNSPEVVQLLITFGRK